MIRRIVDDLDQREAEEEVRPPPRNSEDEPKKRGRRPANAFGMEKKQPEEWELRGCETITDPEEKERYKKELEKKERQREYYKKWYEKKKAEKEGKKGKKEAKKPAAKKQEKLTLQDLTAEMVEEEIVTPAEESNSDALERLQKLREGFGACGTVPAITEEPVRDLEEEYGEQTKQESVAEEAESVIEEAETVIEEAEDEMPVKTMDATGVAYAEPVELDASATAEEEIPEEERKLTAEMLLQANTMKSATTFPGNETYTSLKSLSGIFNNDTYMLPMKLELTPSQAESLMVFIEDHLIRDIREDPEIDCMDWLADMCEIWRELKQWNTMRFSD